jgi:hypothetical protein
MSAFKTTIPVDIDSVKRLFPKDHTVEKVVFDQAASQIVVIWQTSAIETPYTFPLDFTMPDLEAKKLPKHAKLSERLQRLAPKHPSDPVNGVKVPGAVIPPRPVKPGRRGRNTVKVEV